MQAINTIKKNGFTVEIHYDEDAFSPREDDNMGIMQLEHSRYNLPQEGESIDVPHQCNWQTFTRYMRRYYHATIVLPVWGYEHSGLTIRTGEGPYPCRDQWDSGLPGVIYLTQEKLLEEYGEDTAENRRTATNYLIGEVETYDQYLTGDVYGYVLKDENGEILDSCWGFYGSESVEEESENILNYHIKEQARCTEMVKNSYAL